MICSVSNTSSSLPISPNSFSTFSTPNLKVKNIESSCLFLPNDQVELIVDLTLFEQIQKESHGGWNKKMTEVYIFSILSGTAINENF